VIQRLFGVGLNLQGLAVRASTDISDGLQKQVNEVDEIIGEIRSTIYSLGMGGSTRVFVTMSSFWFRNYVAWWASSCNSHSTGQWTQPCPSEWLNI
jgi:hypothetical protein